MQRRFLKMKIIEETHDSTSLERLYSVLSRHVEVSAMKRQEAFRQKGGRYGSRYLGARLYVTVVAPLSHIYVVIDVVRCVPL